ncbi:MAG TPA: Trm112 family protein [Myxococcales bacterium]|jgi:uncharacterized protein YbaR (Trm112 family)|nr:Trm112 family protein [Myxococcales bacterium]
MLDEQLKKILVCPRCRGDLEFHEDVQEIHCPACRVLYAIEDDVPVMLVDEAKPLSASRLQGRQGS